MKGQKERDGGMKGSEKTRRAMAPKGAVLHDRMAARGAGQTAILMGAGGA